MAEAGAERRPHAEASGGSFFRLMADLSLSSTLFAAPRCCGSAGLAVCGQSSSSPLHGKPCVLGVIQPFAERRSLHNSEMTQNLTTAVFTSMDFVFFHVHVG